MGGGSARFSGGATAGSGGGRDGHGGGELTIPLRTIYHFYVLKRGQDRLTCPPLNPPYKVAYE